jgi:MFS family permease
MFLYYIIFFLFFLGLGSNLASISPYLISNFEGKSEIIFISSQLSVPLGNLFAGWLSDKTKQIRAFLWIGLLLGAPAQYYFYSFPDSWLITLLFAAFQRFLISVNYQWMMIAAIESQGEAMFSKIRTSGTVGFLVIQVILYYTTIPGIEVFKDSAATGKMGGIFYLMTLLFIFKIQKVRISSQEYRFRDALGILKLKHIYMFFIFSFLFYSAYQVTDNYQGRYFQLSYGLQSVYMMWFIGVIWEVPFLLGVPKIVHKFGIFSLISFSFISGLIKFCYLIFSIFLGTELMSYFFQMPHSVFFAGFYMGSIYWLRKTVPSHLYGSVHGFYSIFAIAFGGVVGNLLTGSFLHSKIISSIWISNQMGEKPEHIDFFLVFLYPTIVLIFLFPLFKILISKLPKEVKDLFH